MTRTGFVLEPLDVLFFRDGRSFGAAARVVSGLPTPQVLAGAVRTALLEKAGVPFKSIADDATAGRTFAASLAPPQRWIAEVRCRGPWLCRLPNTKPLDVFVPTPATVHRGKKGRGGDVHMARPLPLNLALPGWRSSHRALWLKTDQQTEAAGGFLDSAGLQEFLDGDPPQQAHPADDLFAFDHRTGNKISGERLTTEEGQLYGISFLSMKRDIGFYAEIDAPDQALDGIAFLAFGGEGKRVKLRRVETFGWPQPQKVSEKKSILLITPLVTDSLGVPPALRDRVVAAAVNSPIAISGWDMAKGGPKPTRFAAPAGSVYYLETNEPIPDLTDDLGFGCFLQGVWTDA